MDLRPTSTLKKGGQKRGSYEYRGIRFRGGRWISEIRVPGESKRIWLGSHPSAERAAHAYDAALYCLRREEGNFNFPNNRRPDLTNKPIGSLTYDEIQSIAMKFSFLGESVETPVLSPPWEVPQLLESAVIPNWEMSNQLCGNKIDIPEEPYIPTFAPEEVPKDPAFLPDGEFLAEQFLQLDQWMVFGEDWMRNSMNVCL